MRGEPARREDGKLILQVMRRCWRIGRIPMLLLLLGLPVYAFLKAKKERLGLVEEPVDVPVDLVDLS